MSWKPGSRRSKPSGAASPSETYLDASSVPQALAKDVAGEFGDPFVAANAATYDGSSFYVPAGFHGRIGTRFAWSLISTPAHPGTLGIAHGEDDQNRSVFATSESQGVLQ